MAVSTNAAIAAAAVGASATVGVGAAVVSVDIFDVVVVVVCVGSDGVSDAPTHTPSFFSEAAGEEGE